jgi:hypothetical protein
MSLNKNTAAVLIVALVAITAIVYLAPPDLVREAFLGIGSAAGILLAAMKPLILRDENRDGVPDLVQDLSGPDLPAGEEEE